MDKIKLSAIDLAKRCYQLGAIDESGKVMFNRKLSPATTALHIGHPPNSTGETDGCPTKFTSRSMRTGPLTSSTSRLPISSSTRRALSRWSSRRVVSQFEFRLSTRTVYPRLVPHADVTHRLHLGPELCVRHARLARTLSHRSSGFPMHRRTSLTIQPASVSADRRADSRQYVST